MQATQVFLFLLPLSVLCANVIRCSSSPYYNIQLILGMSTLATNATVATRIPFSTSLNVLCT
jgi:hypothetical protein